MNFPETERYLYSLGNEVEAMKLGLENIRTVLAELGNPQDNYLKVQVAGTNGKGSVCAFLDSICRKAKIKTGLYTSPHLISITERVRIDGLDIGESEFARIATHIRETAERLLANGSLQYRPTFFEQMTAIALVAFAEARVDLAILETGLGGRLDATTAANAEIAAITRIDLDHQEYLGDTIEQIAAEKAAIIQTNSRVVVLDQSPAVMSVVHLQCKNVSAKQLTTAELPVCDFGNLKLGLLGDHQTENARVAMLVTEFLREDFEINKDALTAGLASARHPGRLEYHGRFLLDGAHNVGGAKALAEFIRENERRPITMIFAAMTDKRVADMLAELNPIVTRIIFTKATNSRSMSCDDLERALEPGSRIDLLKTENVGDAIVAASTVAKDKDVILIAGSLYLVGEARKIILENSAISI